MPARIPSIPPIIQPVDKDTKRPLWSVMIPVYNCSQFFPETIQSVLAENISSEEMEIEVVDDASTDADVEAIVCSIGKGRVKYFRQPANVGSLRNFETCLNRAKGQFIHLLHGDDRIKPGYYQKISNLFERFPEAGAACCGIRKIDDLGGEVSIDLPLMEQEGILQNWLARIAERNLLQYSAVTVRREVYEKLGGFYGSTGGEDWEMWARIAQLYSFVYTPASLAEYRQHALSITGDKFVKGEAIRDAIRVMKIVGNYLPRSERRAVLKRSKKFHGMYHFELTMKYYFMTRDRKSTLSRLRQIFSMYKGNAAMYLMLIRTLKIMLLHNHEKVSYFNVYRCL